MSRSSSIVKLVSYPKNSDGMFQDGKAVHTSKISGLSSSAIANGGGLWIGDLRAKWYLNDNLQHEAWRRSF